MDFTIRFGNCGSFYGTIEVRIWRIVETLHLSTERLRYSTDPNTYGGGS